MEDEWLLKAGPDRVKGPLMLLVRNHHSVPCACAVREVTFFTTTGGAPGIGLRFIKMDCSGMTLELQILYFLQ